MATQVEDIDIESCIRDVVAIFQDICPEYLRRLIAQYGTDSAAIIHYVVDQTESGAHYPRKPRGNGLKRKRGSEEPEGDDFRKKERKYGNFDRKSVSPARALQIRRVIAGDFPLVPIKKIQSILQNNNRLLFPSYIALYEEVKGKTVASHPDIFKHKRSPRNPLYSRDKIVATIRDCLDPVDKEMLEELQAARETCALRDEKELADMIHEKKEQQNFQDSQEQGLIDECKCCFSEVPVNRLVYCDGNLPHGFCVSCSRRNAESLVGISKYEIVCMSMEPCSAKFCSAERAKFLDDKLQKALDRIEQEAVLRLACLDDLVTCPFCSYAAEYPPVEKDREFRCLSTDCQIVSCRLCKSETHVPKTCDEAAKDRGYSARHGIEEAMSAAMIRKCNKCSTPFIRESGCNKMTCTRKGCHNIQCYICSENCDYTHFNEAERGGKTGNCTLFDGAETRHQNEVRRAEEDARKAAAENNPDLDAEFLAFHMSDKVAEDDERRKRGDYPDAEQPRDAERRRRMHEQERYHQLRQAVNNVARQPQFVPPAPMPDLGQALPNPYQQWNEVAHRAYDAAHNMRPNHQPARNNRLDMPDERMLAAQGRAVLAVAEAQREIRDARNERQFDEGGAMLAAAEVQNDLGKIQNEGMLAAQRRAVAMAEDQRGLGNVRNERILAAQRRAVAIAQAQRDLREEQNERILAHERALAAMVGAQREFREAQGRQYIMAQRQANQLHAHDPRLWLHNAVGNNENQMGQNENAHVVLDLQMPGEAPPLEDDGPFPIPQFPMPPQDQLRGMWHQSFEDLLNFDIDFNRDFQALREIHHEQHRRLVHRDEHGPIPYPAINPHVSGAMLPEPQAQRRLPFEHGIGAAEPQLWQHY